MSAENVQLVRRALEAHGRGDRAAWLALHDDDLELNPIPDWPETVVGRGSESVWETYGEFFDLFESVPIEDVEVVDGNGDKVVVNSRYTLRGGASGVDVSFEYWLVITVREGLIVRNDWFADRSEALSAAGVRE